MVKDSKDLLEPLRKNGAGDDVDRRSSLLRPP